MDMRDHARDLHAERSNRVPVSLGRVLLLTVIGLQAILFVALEIWLTVNLSLGTALIVGVIVTALWIVWLRMVEFDRFTGTNAAPPTQRFKRPE
jgi:hypothetical protein